jgi:hypothetical protein
VHNCARTVQVKLHPYTCVSFPERLVVAFGGADKAVVILFVSLTYHHRHIRHMLTVHSQYCLL